MEQQGVSALEYMLKIIELNDRRYAEVNIEREKALKIKEEADRDALSLAREIQTYKDEKANELREQINRERGLYATKEDVTALRDYFDALHAPVVEFMAKEQGRAGGIAQFWGVIVSAIVVTGVIVGILVRVLGG